ncbi:MAG: TRAP transporter large permease [Azospirillaceae bacterium]
MIVEAALGLAGLFALLTLGTPIFIALAAVACVLLLIEGNSIAGLGQHLLDHLNSPTLMAIPFFVMAAMFMKGGGIAKALFDWAALAFRRVRGGLPIAAVAATAIFAAINGSSVATALAMGTMAVPLLIEKGYSRPFVLGLTGTAATLGILIPPSLPLVVYGLISETSVPRLFLAGVVPGLLQALLIVGIIVLRARSQHTAPTERSGQRIAEPALDGFAITTLRAVPALSVPFVVLGGIYGGFVTITEAAALSAVIALAVTMFIYRGATVRELPRLMGQSIESTGSVVLIVGSALLLSHWITRSGLAADLVALVVELGLPAWLFLLIMNVTLIVLGMILEGYSITLITVPLTLPILAALEISRVHYGIVLVMNIELAMLTPPIGLNLFVMAGIAKAPVAEVIRGTLPFLVGMIGLVMLVTFYSPIVTFLPDLILGPAAF